MSQCRSAVEDEYRSHAARSARLPRRCRSYVINLITAFCLGNAHAAHLSRSHIRRSRACVPAPNDGTERLSDGISSVYDTRFSKKPATQGQLISRAMAASAYHSTSALAPTRLEALRTAAASAARSCRQRGEQALSQRACHSAARSDAAARDLRREVTRRRRAAPSPVSSRRSFQHVS